MTDYEQMMNSPSICLDCGNKASCDDESPEVVYCSEVKK
jgi:hypothetical protein